MARKHSSRNHKPISPEQVVVDTFPLENRLPSRSRASICIIPRFNHNNIDMISRGSYQKRFASFFHALLCSWLTIIDSRRYSPITWTRQIAQVSHSTSQLHMATAFHFFSVNILSGLTSVSNLSHEFSFSSAISPVVRLIRHNAILTLNSEENRRKQTRRCSETVRALCVGTSQT